MNGATQPDPCACGKPSVGFKDGFPICAVCKENEESHKFGQCLCSLDAFRIKNGLGVCRRCYSIEKRMYGRRQLTSGGMTRFPNPKQYEMGEAVDAHGRT